MTTVHDTIRSYFSKLGLSPEIADLYIALHLHGPQNISALSRSSGVERTRIYRLIAQLLESNLIEVTARGTRGIVQAAPIANLRILIRQKEEALKSLQEELGLVEQILARNSLGLPGLRLQLYQGRSGLQQMLEGELRATAGVIGYQNIDLQACVGKEFWASWQQKLKQHAISRTVITLDDGALSTACSIYGDVVAFYVVKDGTVCGTEIYSQEIAAAQRLVLNPLLARHAKMPRS